MDRDDVEAHLKFLRETPAVIEELTAGLPSEAIVWKPSPDEFSVLENACHLRDLESEGYAVRIERMLAESNPELPDFAGGILARERSYNSQELGEALARFTRARVENVRTLNSLSSDALQRSGVLESVGPVTVLGLIAKMREHDQSHRDELRDLRTQLASRFQ
jgi:hypothetical protein